MLKGVMLVLILLGFLQINPAECSQRSATHTTNTVVVPMTITAMSINDHPSLKQYWWRQAIPTFYEHHMDMLNITLQNVWGWEDNTHCRPRFFALISNQQAGHELFLHGGIGMLKYTFEQHTAEMKCYYKSNVGTNVFPASTDPEGFIGLAVYCPIWRSDAENVAAFCDYLSSQTVVSEFILLSTNTSAAQWPVQPQFNSNHNSTDNINTTTTSSSSSMNGSDYNLSRDDVSFSSLLETTTEVMTSSVTTTRGHITAPPSSPPLSSSYLAVCTVQTYYSPVSGPMLYLFAHYYYLIGFQVIIYDRYGRHQSFLQELIDSGKVWYHSYSAFELARPDVYTAERANQEVMDR
jgi:hypothetical protein